MNAVALNLEIHSLDAALKDGDDAIECWTFIEVLLNKEACRFTQVGDQRGMQVYAGRAIAGRRTHARAFYMDRSPEVGYMQF
jgi:hypothetical protein